MRRTAHILLLLRERCERAESFFRQEAERVRTGPVPEVAHTFSFAAMQWSSMIAVLTEEMKVVELEQALEDSGTITKVP